MGYEIKRWSGNFTTKHPDLCKVKVVLNTCRYKICEISFLWQVFFYDQPKSRKKTEISRIADTSFLTALKRTTKLKNRRKNNGSSSSSL